MTSEKELQSCNRSSTLLNSCNSDLPEEIEESTDQNTKTIMSIIIQGRVLGCVYFDMETNVLHVMADVIDAGAIEIVKLLIFQIRPTTIITGMKQPENFIELLNDKDTISEGCIIETLPLKSFNFSSGKSRLEAVCSGILDDRWTHNEKKILTLSLINLDNAQMVRCAAALLDHLQQLYLGDVYQASSGPEILSVESFNLKDFLNIDPNSMLALQIFDDDSHPNANITRANHRMSLFKLMNVTKTAIGQQMLRSWFMRPLQDLIAIRQRHAAVQLFSRLNESDTLFHIKNCLRHFKNISKLARNLENGISRTIEWQGIHQSLLYGTTLRNLVNTLQRPEIPILQKIIQAFPPTAHEVALRIYETVDMEESVNEGRVVIKRHVDTELDELKRAYHGLDDFLYMVAQRVIKQIPSAIAYKINVVYFPQFGFLLAIPKSPSMQHPADFNLPQHEFQFSTETMFYYKNAEMRELDKDIGDIHTVIVEREREILFDLQKHVLSYIHLYDKMNEAIAEIDCLVALAEISSKYHYICPTMTENDVIFIKDGRHPLSERFVPAFISNDTIVEQQQEQTEKRAKRIILLTGANASGKSIYLKQIALIVFMAHIGSFVPATEATIGLTDKIFTRLQTRESISLVQSTFLIDSQQVSNALKYATARSLVLLDEFGKGTIAEDGASLFAGVIQYLAEKPWNHVPRVVASTHFHQIVPFLAEIKSISFKTMQTTFDRQQNIVYLYKLQDGRKSDSFGYQCARLSGLDEKIIKRAMSLKERLDEPLDELEVLRAEERKYIELSRSVVEDVMNFREDNMDQMMTLMQKVKEIQFILKT